jgi:tRNA1Val (adenine37-N6)-methyltransferase
MPRVPTPFFRFKQFTVWHDRSALRVCTEACILGAYAEVGGVTNALDIGTGTGLLALMMAQRNTQMRIDAVEIDEQNVEQALENVAQSPFLERISVHQAAVQDWDKEKTPHSSLLTARPRTAPSNMTSSSAILLFMINICFLHAKSETVPCTPKPFR